MKTLGTLGNLALDALREHFPMATFSIVIDQWAGTRYIIGDCDVFAGRVAHMFRDWLNSQGLTATRPVTVGVWNETPDKLTLRFATGYRTRSVR